MCAPIPKDKWSWKFPACIKCGTDKKTGRDKHEGKGLCLGCHQKEYRSRPNVRERLLNEKKAYQLNIKTSDRYRDVLERHKERLREWRNDPDSTYHILKKVWNRRIKFRLFIRNQRKGIGRPFRKNRNGLKFRCDGCSKECLITSPFQPDDISKGRKMHELQLFKKIIIQECNK